MEEKTNRIRTKTCNFREIKKQIRKAQKIKTGTSNSKINAILTCVPNFIGCFAEDQVSKMIFNSFPSFLIVNIDSSSMKGSHWIALGIFKNRIEIFDPLGFNFLNWSRIPCHLLTILHRLSQYRRVFISRRIQSDNSILCAFFCIYFCIFRNSVSFSKICQPFHSRLALNDKILIKLFS